MTHEEAAQQIESIETHYRKQLPDASVADAEIISDLLRHLQLAGYALYNLQHGISKRK